MTSGSRVAAGIRPNRVRACTRAPAQGGSISTRGYLPTCGYLRLPDEK